MSTPTRTHATSLRQSNRFPGWKRLFYTPLVFILAVSLFGASGSEGVAAPEQSGIFDITTNLQDYPGNQVPRFNKFEVSFKIDANINPDDPAAINPYAPEEIQVDGCFFSPLVTPDPAGCEHGILQPGFYYQNYRKELDPATGGDRYVPDGSPEWKVRFAPRQEGTYHYFIQATTGGGLLETTPLYTFDTAASSNPGFIQTQTGSRYFRFETGAPFLGVGLNVGWWEYDTQALRMYNDFLTHMNRYGVNMARVWMTNSVVEGSNNNLLLANKILSIQDKALGGQYNLRDAWYFDQILAQAEDLGIYFILTLEDGHQFAKDEIWSQYNLYNEANHGILADRYDIFDNSTAIMYQERVFRYVVSRWGYSTSILSWELYNEIDELVRKLLVNNPTRFNLEWGNLLDWHQSMGDYLQGLDAHNHLINTSTGSFQIHHDLYSDLPQMGFAQMHYYFVEGENSFVSDPLGKDMADLTWYYAYTSTLAYGTDDPVKPMILGEFGLVGPKVNGKWSGSQWRAKDDKGLHLHNALWASLMSGMAATSLHWNWQNYWHPDTSWWRHYAAISNYFKDIDTSGLEVMQPVNVELSGTCSDSFCTDNPKLRAMGLQHGDLVFAWIQNTENTWWNYTQTWAWLTCRNENHTQSGAVTIRNLSSSLYYRVEWWDPYETDPEHQIIRTETKASTGDGEIMLFLDNFDTDIAVKIYPARGALTVTKTATPGTAALGGSVEIRTDIHNSGAAYLSNLIITDPRCPQSAIAGLPPNATLTYLCEIVNLRSDAVFTTTVSTLLSSGDPYGDELIRHSARLFVPVADGLVGSGSIESCTESAFDTDLFLSTLKNTVAFNCTPAGHKYSIPFTQQKTISTETEIIGGDNLLSGGNQGRVFEVRPGSKLILDSINIVNGAAHRCDNDPGSVVLGGGIWNGGLIEATNTKFYDNEADYAGGILNDAGAEISLTGGRFGNNRARTAVWGESGPSTEFQGGDGGAMFTAGTAAIRGALFSSNRAAGGGAILNWFNGVLDISSSVFDRNIANLYGGAIETGVNGNVRIAGSLFTGNEALQESGGAIANFDSSNYLLSIDNSTFSGNKADEGGGAIWSQKGEVVIASSTINGNQARRGGGISIPAGSVEIESTILTGNRLSQGGEDGPDCDTPSGIVTSNGDNLLSAINGCALLLGPGDQYGVLQSPLDPLLGALKDNGGPVSTFALLPGSPAMDMRTHTPCSGADSRGLLRPQGAACDVGAYELAMISVSDVDISEGDGETVFATFEVSLPGVAVEIIHLNFVTEDGTAIAGVDYQAVTGSATITEGLASVQIAIPILGDTSVEPDETFSIRIAEASGAFVQDEQGVAVLRNDDDALSQERQYLPIITR